MNNTLVVAFLVLAALIGLYVGIGLVFTPAEMQAQSQIILGDNASHFSETRAPGMAILSASLFAILAVFRLNLRKTALTIMALFFLSYGLGRLLSLALDGMPADGLFYAMIGELFMGVLAFVVLLRLKGNEKMKPTTAIGA